jgi:phage-related holin
MTPKRALIIQSFLEAFLPIYGYLYWKWDVSFILLFYFLDWSLFLGIAIAKAKKRIHFSGDSIDKKDALKLISHGVATMILTILLIWNTIPRLVHPFSWTERIVSFITYKEMGVPQGVLLIPLILLNGLVLYKQQFIRTKQFEYLNVRALIHELKLQGWMITAGATIAFVTAILVRYPSEIVIGTTILGCFGYRVLRRTQAI